MGWAMITGADLVQYFRIGHPWIRYPAEGDQLRQQDPKAPNVWLDREPEDNLCQLVSDEQNESCFIHKWMMLPEWHGCGDR